MLILGDWWSVIILGDWWKGSEFLVIGELTNLILVIGESWGVYTPPHLYTRDASTSNGHINVTIYHAFNYYLEENDTQAYVSAMFSSHRMRIPTTLAVVFNSVRMGSFTPGGGDGEREEGRKGGGGGGRETNNTKLECSNLNMVTVYYICVRSFTTGDN